MTDPEEGVDKHQGWGASGAHGHAHASFQGTEITLLPPPLGLSCVPSLEPVWHPLSLILYGETMGSVCVWRGGEGAELLCEQEGVKAE